MPDRRAFLSGLASVPAVAVVSALPATAGMRQGTLRFAELWDALLRARGASTAAHLAFCRACNQLPWWANSGPCDLDHEGNFCGNEVGWPAIQGAAAPTSKGAFRRIRFGLHDLERRREQESGFFGVTRAQGLFERRAADLNARLVAQELEEERVGLPALETAADAAAEHVCDVQEAIMELDPGRADVLSGQVMITILREISGDENPGDSSALTIAGAALRGLLPRITGAIASDVAEFVHQPDRCIEQMRFYTGILPIGGPPQPVRGLRADAAPA